MKQSQRDIDRHLKQIARDTMLVAVVLIICASLLDLALLSGARQAYWLVSGATLVLLAPGVWYAYAAATMRQASAPVVKWTMLVAVGQLATCVLAIPIAYYVDPTFAVATGVLIFFLPALLVLLFQLWRARHLIRVREAARGFALASRGDEVIGTAEIVPDAQIVEAENPQTPARDPHLNGAARP